MENVLESGPLEYEVFYLWYQLATKWQSVCITYLTDLMDSNNLKALDLNPFRAQNLVLSF